MRAVLTPLVVAILVLTLGPSVSADDGDTERRKQQTDAQVRRSAQKLEDLSGQLRDAVVAMEATEARIPAAQTQLSRVRGTLAAARARDAALAVKLQRARARQRRTKTNFELTQSSVKASTSMVGRIARTAYQNGSLSEWAAVIGSETPQQLASGLAALQSTSRAQGALLVRLGEDRADLAAARATIRAYAAQVAQMKAAQRAFVVRIEGLEAQALAATRRLQALARERATAAARVRTERAAERGRYERAVAESRRLALRIAAERRAAERRLERQRRRMAAREAAHALNDGGGNVGGGGGGSTAGGDSGGGGGGSGLLWPVPGPITTTAGPRTNPVTGRASCHAGIDVGAGYGTPIRAMASGIVLQTTVIAWDGYTTVIAHGGGLTTWYAHQSRFAVRPGQNVSRGEIIGYVGSTGFSTGPHLHFNVAIDEVAYDPLGWFGGSRRTVASMCPGGPSPVL